jgi:hypothetical protein
MPRLYLGNALLRLGRAGEAREAYAAYLARAEQGREADRVRKLVQKISGPTASGGPGTAPPPPPPSQPGSR